MREMCGFDRACASALPPTIRALLAVSSGAAVLAYGTVALHVEVSPDSKSSAKTHASGNGSGAVA